MKTRLDKCLINILTSVTLPIDMYSCGVLLDIAMQKSILGVFLIFFSESINSVFSGTKKEVEYKELFGKELRTKWQHYFIMHRTTKNSFFFVLTIMLDTQSEYLFSRTNTNTGKDDERSRISYEMGLNVLGFHRITFKKITNKQPQIK